MSVDLRAVLDACVLIPMPLADTLLRMAEHPRLYRPFWSERIMAEVTSNLIGKWKHSPEKASRRAGRIREAFPEASVEGYEPFIQAVNNHQKDRHVLAAAVCAKANLIVTYNKKDFPHSAINPWNIECRGPSGFLRSLYDLDPAIATNKLHEQADTIRISYKELLVRLQKAAPGFIQYVCEKQNIKI